MEMTIDFWTLLGGITGILVTFLTLLLSGGKLLLSQFEKRLDVRFVGFERTQRAAETHMDVRFTTIETAMAKGNEEVLRIERELMQLKAELPGNYVRRDDFIRIQSVIETKIDGLAARIENAILRGENYG